MDNIYGMIILLSIGLGIATIIAMAELLIYKGGSRREGSDRVM